jgi:hypothetical protein
LDPGVTVEVWSGNIGQHHLWWGVYAFSDTGYWAGEYRMAVPDAAFQELCYGDPNSNQVLGPGLDRIAGFRGLLVPAGTSDANFTLV